MRLYPPHDNAQLRSPVMQGLQGSRATLGHPRAPQSIRKYQRGLGRVIHPHTVSQLALNGLAKGELYTLLICVLIARIIWRLKHRRI